MENRHSRNRGAPLERRRPAGRGASPGADVPSGRGASSGAGVPSGRGASSGAGVPSGRGASSGRSVPAQERFGGSDAGRAKKRRKKETDFVVQGSILAVAGIIVRLIGILYRVPMTNIIGDEGMGYYSTAFNVYNIMLILSSYSLPLAVSKMVAGRMARGQYRNALRVFKAALLYATVAGGLACFITWHFADFFADSVFNTPFCIYALKTLAPTIWIMAYLGVLRGFFQGHGTMIPTALSQIFEQIANAVISVVAAGVLFKIGHDSNLVYHTTGYPEAFGAAGGTIGTGAGALTALFFSLILFLMYIPMSRKKAKRERRRRLDSYGSITITFFMTVAPVILSSAVYNINAVVDNSIMAHGMEAMGQGEEFLSLWGIYNNKYMLLVHVPLAMANSLASSLIPSLSAAMARSDYEAVLNKAGMVIRVAMLIAIPSAVGLAVLAAPINQLLFHSGDHTEAVRMLAVGSSAVVFLSLSTVSNAILQGINHMAVPVRNAFIALVIHVAALYVFLMVFKLGIYSVVYANMLFAFLMCFLNAMSIRGYLGYRQEIKKTFFLPAVSSALMGACAYGVYRGMALVLKNSLAATAVAVAAAVLAYGVLLVRLKCVEEEELYAMPKGKKILKVCRKLRLM